jgi:AcrR family transcriptional regulator/DNA-binding MarR family transcriptional regulator
MRGTGNIKQTRSIGGSVRVRRVDGSDVTRSNNVEEIQRSRILGAMAEEVAIRGASSVTVARVIARARVSRRLFYELFADIEDCLLATLDWGLEQARAVAVDAYSAERSWLEGIRAALAALLRFFDDRPLLAQLCLVHAAGGGPRVLERRSRAVEELCQVVDRGRAESKGDRGPGPVTAEGVVGAVLAVLYTRVLDRGTEMVGHYDSPVEEGSRLIELYGELMSLIVLPYLGAPAAGRELRRSPPPRKAASRAHSETADATSPHSHVAARMTYRTVQVLRAIAELPAASNREVAERAGIVDQGQISKILTRLEYQGLAVNRGGSGPARGTPNSWWLTERGEALERELREPPSVGRKSDRRPGGGSEARRPAK